MNLNSRVFQYDMSFPSPVIDKIPKNLNIFSTVLYDLGLIALTPPSYGIKSISRLFDSQRVPSQLVKLYSVAELSMKEFKNVKRAGQEAIN